MKTKYFFAPALTALALTALTTSCSNDDEGSGTPAIDPATTRFVVFSGDPVTDLQGGVSMKVFSDMSKTYTDQSVYGAEGSLKCPDSFTQETYNSQSGVFTGFIYARGASAEGIGALKAGLRSYKLSEGKLQEIGAPVYLDNFGNTGTFGPYTYAAQISNPVVVRVDAQGNGQTITLDLTKLAINEINPAISNIVDLGDNKVALILTYTGINEAYVAFADYDLKVSEVIHTDKIGQSVGAMRSVRYTQSGTDDAGNLYVFCGSDATDGKVGAMRINKGSETFDPGYKFDILAKSGGYRFRKAFHIGDDKFLIEFYTATDKYGNMDPSGKMAVVDMSEQSLTWVTGLPDPSTVSISWGEGFNGSYYLPIAAATEMSGGSGGGGGRPVTSALASLRASSVIPTIYRIDGTTGMATPFMTFATTDLLKGICIVK